MARRPAGNGSTPERPIHSVEEKRQDIIRLQRRISELESFDPNQVSSRFSDPAVTALETAIASTLATIFGERTTAYNRYASATRLDNGAIILGGHHNEAAEARRHITEGKASALALLSQAVNSIEEEIEFAPILLQQSGAPGPLTALPPSHKVFVVHGHDRAAKEALARFLEKIELEAIILHEQPDQGRTIIEKFEECASQVGFAVILMTPDDVGAAKDESAQRTRARQNVIFELGYFAGKLGRGKTCLLRQGNVEIPSDLYGVIYTELDENDGWKMKLVRELKAAGLAFDANKVWQ